MEFAVAPKRWSVVVSAVVLALVVVAEGLAAVSAPAPAKLVGTWKRTVTAKDVSAGGSGVKGGTPCKLEITPKLFTIDCPTWGTYTAKINSASSGRLHITFRVLTTFQETYAWKVAGNHLTLRKIEDPDGNSAVILPGVWKHA